MMNEVTNVYGIDTKKVKEWLKKNGLLIIIVSVAAFAFGYTHAQADMEMDCKYAKAVRINTAAFRCERIL
jgi:predicted negative regulator of RcsB-dependent stress response